MQNCYITSQKMRVIWYRSFKQVFFVYFKVLLAFWCHHMVYYRTQEKRNDIIMNRNRKLVTEKIYYNPKAPSGTAQLVPFSISNFEVMQDKDRSVFYKYTNSFTESPSFSQKRFSRYVEKVADVLLEYCRKLFPNQKIYNLNEWYIDTLNYYFRVKLFGKSETNYNYDFIKLIDTYAVSFYIYYTNTRDNLMNYLSDAYSKIDMSINEIITVELDNACKKYLNRKAITDGELNEANYITRAIPETPMEKLDLLEDILNRCVISIEHITSSDLSVSTIEIVKDGAVQKAKKELSAKNTQIENLTKEMDLLRFQAKTEKKQKESAIQTLGSANIQKKQAVSPSYHQKVKRDIKAKKDTNKRSEVFQHKLLEGTETVKETERKELPQLCDFGNYVFVVNSDLRLAKRIKSEFPKSHIISGSKKIKLENVDMVIAMTRSISHAWYYGIKKQCKTKGILFVHCPSTNMDELKLLIQKTFWGREK